MPVLDASVYVSYLSPHEAHHADALRMYDAVPAEERFLVPAVFRLEVVAALARRGEVLELLDAVDALAAGPKFEAIPVESALLDAALHVARTAKLRAYDALYAALALARDTTLFTLDGEVRRRLKRAFPKFDVVAPYGNKGG